MASNVAGTAARTGAAAIRATKDQQPLGQGSMVHDEYRINTDQRLWWLTPDSVCLRAGEQRTTYATNHEANLSAGPGDLLRLEALTSRHQ